MSTVAVTWPTGMPVGRCGTSSAALWCFGDMCGTTTKAMSNEINAATAKGGGAGKHADDAVVLVSYGAIALQNKSYAKTYATFPPFTFRWGCQ
jgi:hypothetical protein